MVTLALSPVTAQAPKAAARNQGRRARAIAGQSSIVDSRKTRNPFQSPPEMDRLDFNDLKLQVGSFENRHPADVDAPDRFELLCYNGKPVGPTIRVRRGKTFHIHLTNQLDPSADPDPQKPTDGNPTYPASAVAQQPHDLCTTNLHTHGLHVSPANNADNILDVAVGPKGDKVNKSEFTFEYTVPGDHPSGTFWYHPHRHGSVAYQLSNGVAGALIVEGSKEDTIPDLDDVPEIAAAKERILVFQLYNYRKGDDNVGRIDASTIYNVTPDAFACTAIKMSGPAPVGDTPQVTAINGVINPVIHIAPGQVQRWRMIHAAWDMNRNLSIYTDGDVPATDMKFNEIALDGLATGKMVEKTAVALAPGQRSDALIQAPLLGEGEGERVYHLYQDNTPATGSPHGRPQDKFYLAKIVVRGEPCRMHLPDPSSLARYQPFAPIGDEELSDPSSFPNGLVFSATDGGSMAPNDVPHYTVNGKAYDANAAVQIRLNTAEQWTISAQSVDGKSSHPFHIHVNPFQVVQHKDAQGTISLRNEWRDTLFISEGESYTIRSRFKDFVGKTVIHCHILDHEDQGMMMNIEFIPPYQTPDASKPVVLKPAFFPAPAMKLADAAGAWLDLAEFRGRNVALVFFQGAECAHCAEKLRDLVRDARGSTGPAAEIVAVSSRRVADAGRTLKALGVSASDRFHLLVDEGHRAFRDFGCYGGGPKHGLFLIDGGGVVRARYVGETPFGDTREAVRRVNTLTPAGGESASR
jgi:FtsP/CotA-like multicopper oxidase with cupredoxin domain/peroxiredoxin